MAGEKDAIELLKQNIQDLNAAGGQYVRQTQEAGDTYKAAVEANNAAYDSATSTAVDDLQEAGDNYQSAVNEAVSDFESAQAQLDTDFYDIVKGYQSEYDKQKAEDAIRMQEEDRRARWTAGTEAAAAVANLIGVGSFNAANQVYKSYSQEWMKQADQERRYRKQRMDQTRDRLKALQMQQVQLRYGSIKDLANMKTAAAGTGYTIGKDVINLGLGIAGKEAELGNAAAAAGYSTAKDIAAANYGVAGKNAEAQGSLAQAYITTSRSRGSGNGNGSGVLEFNVYDENGNPVAVSWSRKYADTIMQGIGGDKLAEYNALKTDKERGAYLHKLSSDPQYSKEFNAAVARKKSDVQAREGSDSAVYSDRRKADEFTGGHMAPSFLSEDGKKAFNEAYGTDPSDMPADAPDTITYNRRGGKGKEVTYTLTDEEKRKWNAYYGGTGTSGQPGSGAGTGSYKINPNTGLPE